MTTEQPDEERTAQPDEELDLEQAVAFGVDGYEPDDPWNAVLYLEGERTATVLALTPTHLDYLVPQLDEVRAAQRAALGVPADDNGTEPDAESRGAVHRVAHAARVATGGEPVARMWRESPRGRATIIIGAIVFVALGALLSLLT